MMTPGHTQRFVVIAGKGGVGRTTVAAAMALGKARHGQRVLLAQARAKDSVHRLLGGPPVGESIVELAPNLWAVNMTPRAALREYGLMILRFETVYRAVFENRVVRTFLRAVPGLDDYSLLGKAWFHTTERVDGRARFDCVIFDGPATGHLLPLLRIPRVILDAVPPGPLRADAANIWRLLQDPQQTAVHLVTLLEEMPTSETLELEQALRDELKLPLGLLIVNGVYPDLFATDTPAARILERLGSTEDPALESVVARANLYRMRRELQEEYLRRLADSCALPRVELPMLFGSPIGAPEISALSELLRAGRHNL